MFLWRDEKLRINSAAMQPQRVLIPSFRAWLLTAAASLTLFLPAAISMNSIAPSPNWVEFRPLPSPEAARDLKGLAPKTRQTGRPVKPTTPGSTPRVLQDEIHHAPLKKTKGRQTLQTAAIVGSFAAVAAAKAAGDEDAATAVRRFSH